jgi:small basic protein (TIGR04137 family)
MTMHSSLKSKSGALNQHRNVLTRAERIAKLSSQEKFKPGQHSPLGLVKVGNIRAVAKKKPKAEGEAAATPAAGANAAAPAAQGTAPAAKGAAPASKGGDAKKK